MKNGMTLLAALAAFATPALADGIPVEPGLWKITTTMNMPMMPEPQAMSIEQCYEDAILDMDDMAAEDANHDCSFDMKQLDGDTMSWSVDCPVEGGTMHAEWQATSSGGAVDGEGTMTMDVMGQKMDMTMSWHGERVGACS